MSWGQPWTPEEYQAFLRKRNGNKHHAQRTSKDEHALFPEMAGRSFGSRLERERGQILCAMLHAGEISELEFQPRVFLTRAAISFHADFKYVENGVTWWEDAKGFGDIAGKRDRRWAVIKQLWTVYGPGPLRITHRVRGGAIKVKKEIWPK